MSQASNNSFSRARIAWLARFYRWPLFLFVLAALHVSMTYWSQPPARPKSEFGNLTFNARKTSPAPWIPEFFKNWRRHFIQGTQKSDSTGLVAGIFLGATDRISNEHYALFQQAGLLHTLAASGSNCWIVAMLLHGFFAFLLQPLSLRFFPSRLTLRIKKDLLHWSFLAGGLIFFLWSDQSPPIARALILIVTRFLFFVFDHRAPFWRILLVHYSLSLIIAPTLWFNVSFQLTYSCIAGMVAAHKIKAGLFPNQHGSLLDYVVTTLGASIGATPITFIVFGEINFTGLFTNAIIGPLISLTIMPLALIGMLLAHTPLVGVPIWLAAQFCKFGVVLLSTTLDFVPALQYFH